MRALKHFSFYLLVACSLAYSVFFSLAAVGRMHTFNAHYYDLGIMNQTVFNTYDALKTADAGKILEMTDPNSDKQIKRMGIHNDILLAFLAPFYFIYDRAETLLVIQSIALGVASLFLYGCVLHIFPANKDRYWFGLVAGILYLLSPIVHKINLYEFHAVALAIPLLFAVFYFYLTKRWRLMFIAAVLAMFSKEQVPLLIAFLGIYIMGNLVLQKCKNPLVCVKKFISALQSKTVPPFILRTEVRIGVSLLLLGVVWFVLSMKVIIPLSRPTNDTHFALSYFEDFGTTPGEVVANTILRPDKVTQILFQESRLNYVFSIFSGTAFLALLAPEILFIAAPELGINILSSNSNMRLMIYHYDAALVPFLFLAALFGIKRLSKLFGGKFSRFLKLTKFSKFPVMRLVFAVWVIAALTNTYVSSPVMGKNANYFMFDKPDTKSALVAQWQAKLENSEVPVSTSGKLAPFFSGRRFFYTLSNRYSKADYVLLLRNEPCNSYGMEYACPAYKKLKQDSNYRMIVNENGFEVYQKIGL